VSASILFVCTANRVRSPLAAAVARSVVEATALPVSISSAGLLPAGFPADPDMAHVAARRGYDLSAHVSRQVDAGLIERSDLVIAMTGRHVVDLVGMAPGATRRILTLREAGTAATLSAPSAWDPISLRRWAETPTDRPLGELLGGRHDTADPMGRSMRRYRAAADEIEQLTSALFGQHPEHP